MIKEFTINNKFLKELRLKNRLTQQEVADNLSCSVSHIQKIEQNICYFYNCNFSFVIKYFEFLGIDQLYFFSIFKSDFLIWTKFDL